MYNITTEGHLIDLDEIYDTELHQRGRKKQEVECKEDLLNFVKDILFSYMKELPKFELIEKRIKISQYGDYFKKNEGYVFYFNIQFRHPVTTFGDTITITLNDIENIKKDDVVIPKVTKKIFRHYIELMNIHHRYKNPNQKNKGIKQTEEHIYKRAKANSKPVCQLDKYGNVIKKWDSASQASKELGIYQQNISRCCKGKYKSAGGFRWIYAK